MQKFVKRVLAPVFTVSAINWPTSLWMIIFALAGGLFLWMVGRIIRDKLVLVPISIVFAIACAAFSTGIIDWIVFDKDNFSVTRIFIVLFTLIILLSINFPRARRNNLGENFEKFHCQVSNDVVKNIAGIPNQTFGTSKISRNDD